MSPFEAFEKFRKFSKKTKFELLFYPVFLIWQMPVAWAKSLWCARVLLNGQWDRYMGFSPENSINSLFYRTQWININRYGRRGISPILGLGAYPLRNWFHLSSIASYIYSNAGAVVTLLGTMVWAFSHLIWMEATDPIWVLAVTFTLFFSSTAYAMAFARQNYQILGWMWLPTALYAITTGQWVLGSMAWFAAAIFGITPVFFSIPIITLFACTSENWMFVVATLVPALILTISRFYFLIKNKNLKTALISMAKLIGMTTHKVRYLRPMKKLSLVDIYFVLLYLSGVILTWQLLGVFPALSFLGLVLYIINQRYFRVADDQSMIMIVVSLWAIAAMDFPGRWEMLLIFWLVSSPSGIFLLIQHLDSNSGHLSLNSYRPFDHTSIMNAVADFFISIKKGEKVYFSFSNPDNDYSKIFDNYRVIHEMALHVAAIKEIHLFPDWYTVQETNYIGAPECWGRSVDAVSKMCLHWNVDYAVVYQNTASVLGDDWQNKFELISELDWSKFIDRSFGRYLGGKDIDVPKWFLIKMRPDSVVFK